MHLRATHSSKDGEEGKTEENDVKFLVMNSFNTSEDTMTYLQNNYPELASDPTLEVMQNKVPKIDAATGLPGDYSSAPRHEWFVPQTPLDCCPFSFYLFDVRFFAIFRPYVFLY